jgi:hypothetical protein
MAAGLESSSAAEDGSPVGAAIMDLHLDDSASFSHSSPILPPRLRRRLLECKTSPRRSTAEDIQAKLRDADLRRQVSTPYFHFLRKENLDFPRFNHFYFFSKILFLSLCLRRELRERSD